MAFYEATDSVGLLPHLVPVPWNLVVLGFKVFNGLLRRQADGVGEVGCGHI